MWQVPAPCQVQRHLDSCCCDIKGQLRHCDISISPADALQKSHRKMIQSTLTSSQGLERPKMFTSNKLLYFSLMIREMVHCHFCNSEGCSYTKAFLEKY